MPQNIRLHFILKKAFLAILFLSCFTRLVAQTKYGVTAGAGKASLFNFAVPPADNNSYSSTSSFWAGITADKPLIPNSINLFIAAVYNTKGYKYFLQNESGANNTVKDSGFTQNIKYVDLNLNFRKKFTFGEDEEHPNSFFIGTGPVLSVLAGGKEKLQVDYFGNSAMTVDNTNSKLASGNGPGKYKPVFFSWGFVAGFQINNFSVWINTNLPLTDYFQDAQQAVKHKVKTFGINASYALFTHIKKEKPEKPARNVPVIVKDTLIDSDGDGIPDVRDKCPGIKGTAKYFGCPVPDTDGDGVNDDEDSCITLPGTAANHGCPVLPDTAKTTPKDTTCYHVYNVYFEPGKSILRSEAYATLTIVVNQLKVNSKLRVVFRGNTDNVGSQEANFSRSLDRASVCAAYVASFYISKDRLSILSYGNTRPVADLNDPLLQWKNRRVEVCIYEAK